MALCFPPGVLAPKVQGYPLPCMNARRRADLLGAVLALAVPAALPAAGAADRCIAIDEDALRLACYDAALGRPAQALPAPASVQVPAPPANAAPPASAATAPPFPVPPRVTETPRPPSFTSEVDAVERGRDGQFIATLANGQVWEQSERNSAAVVREGDTVTIRRAALGSYLLLTSGGIATRVRQVK